MEDTGFRLEYHIETNVDIEKIKKLIVIREEKGYVVEGDTVSEWAFTGYIEKNKQHFLYGVTGKVVSLEKMITQSRKKALQAVLTLVKALQVLSQDEKRQYEIGLETVYFTETGGVLFLPASIIRKLKDAAPDEFRKNFHKISNPYFIKQNERSVYAIETLLFYILTDNFPFSGETENDLRNKMRNMNIPSPKSFLPEMKPDVARQFEVFFNTKNQCMETMPRLEKMISQWIEEDVTQTILPQEREAILNEATKEKGRRDRILKRKLFWERNGKTVVFSTIGGVIGSIVLFLFVSIYFQPRKTQGFLPEKIVESYYQSINTLDTELIKDCYINGAGDEMQGIITNIFPRDRQSLAYTGYHLTVPADTWIADGKPQLRPYQFVFGVANMNLEMESDIPDPVFLAEYDFYTWGRDPEKPGEEQTHQLIYHRKERLYFTQDNQDWVIDRIDQLENKLTAVLPFGKDALNQK